MHVYEVSGGRRNTQVKVVHIIRTAGPAILILPATPPPPPPPHLCFNSQTRAATVPSSLPSPNTVPRHTLPLRPHHKPQHPSPIPLTPLVFRYLHYRSPITTLSHIFTLVHSSYQSLGANNVPSFTYPICTYPSPFIIIILLSASFLIPLVSLHHYHCLKHSTLSCIPLTFPFYHHISTLLLFVHHCSLPASMYTNFHCCPPH